jgi:hypothetical protein
LISVRVLKEKSEDLYASSRFEVFLAMKIQGRVFWVVMPCGDVLVDWL